MKGIINMLKRNKKLILVATVILLFFAVIWFYLGWYMSTEQIATRCHQTWVEQEDDYYVARDNFYKCLEQHGITEGKERLFKWEK